MPDENRVFDVSKPGRANPSASGRPVIIGHHPMMPDPMMKTAPDRTMPRPIPIMDTTAEPEPVTYRHGVAAIQSAAPQPDGPASSDGPEYMQSPQPDEPVFGPQPHPDEIGPADFQESPPSEDSVQPVHHDHVQGLHIGQPKRRRKWPWLLLLLLIVASGLYLAIDDKLIAPGVNLPYHVFKSKHQAAVVVTPPPAAPAAAVLPAGFTGYNLSGTIISFAAPTAWGQPASAPDPGYSARGGTNKSDGTYAYLVTFPNNKDVQMAVTSSKYLPAARDTQYYDFLQWCTGTNDGKIYLTTLHYTTADKIDTPTTTSCDQGPLPDTTKINDSTIVQLKVLNVSKAVIGDIYTLNLKSADLPVLRIKDAAMTNGDNIKKMLANVQLSGQ